MKRMALFLGIALAVTILAGNANACTSSYIKAIGDSNQNHPLYQKASQVADKYMEGKGVQKDSAAAKFIKPWVVGVTLFDSGASSYTYGNYDSKWDRLTYTKGRTWDNGNGHMGRNWRQHGIDGKSVDQCVRESNACGHHHTHFGDGQHVYKHYYSTNQEDPKALSRAG